jgi:hypothetical protein
LHIEMSLSEAEFTREPTLGSTLSSVKARIRWRVRQFCMHPLRFGNETKNSDNFILSENLTIHLKLRIASSGMLHRVALVRTDFSEERSASIIRVIKIGELGTTLAATSNRCTLRRNVGSYKSHTS